LLFTGAPLLLTEHLCFCLQHLCFLLSQRKGKRRNLCSQPINLCSQPFKGKRGNLRFCLQQPQRQKERQNSNLCSPPIKGNLRFCLQHLCFWLSTFAFGYASNLCPSRSKATFAFGLAPLLFTVATQPFLAAVQRQERQKSQRQKGRQKKGEAKDAIFALADQRQPLLLPAAPVLLAVLAKAKIAQAKGEAKAAANTTFSLERPKPISFSTESQKHRLQLLPVSLKRRLLLRRAQGQLAASFACASFAFAIFASLASPFDFASVAFALRQ
jgi:hypothetical protein